MSKVLDIFRRVREEKEVWKFRSSLIVAFISVGVFLGIFIASSFYILSSISLISTSATLAIFQFLHTPEFVVPLFTVALVFQALGNEYWMRRVFRFLRARREGKELSTGEIKVVIKDILAFPVRGSLLAAVLWGGAASLFPLIGTYFLQYTRVQAASIGIALISAGLAGILFIYYAFKGILSEILGEAAQAGRIVTRGMSRIFIPIRMKLVVSFMVLLLVGLSLLALLEFISTVRVLKEQAALFGMTRLQEIAEEWEHSEHLRAIGEDFSRVEINHWLRKKTRLVGTRLIYLDMNRKEIVGEGVESSEYPNLEFALKPEELVSKVYFLNAVERFRILIEGKKEGVVFDYGRGDLLVYWPLGAERYVIARYPVSHFLGEMPRIFRFIAAIVILGLFLSLGISRLTAGDISGPFRKILQDSARISSGDLRGRIWIPHGDEVGDLARSLQRMTQGLQTIVRRIDSASQDLNQGLGGISETGENIHHILEEQFDLARSLSQRSATILDTMKELGKIVSQFSGMAQESSSSIFEMDTSIREVFQHLREMSGGINRVLDSLEEVKGLVSHSGRVVSHMTEAFSVISEPVKGFSHINARIAEKSTDSIELAQGVFDQARKTKDQILLAIKGTEKIRTSVSHEVDTYKSLFGSIERIEGVVRMISGVAERTNLLGLNASIIAASSIEYGRNFMVVAEEIKELAERVSNSTQEIAGLIQSLRQISELSQRSSVQAVERIEEQFTLLQAADSSLDMMISQSSGIVGAINEIGNLINGSQGKKGGPTGVDLDRVRELVEGIQTAIRKIEVGEILAQGQRMEEVIRELKMIAEGQADNSRMITMGVEEVIQMIAYFEKVISEEIEKAGKLDEVIREITESSGAALDVTKRIIGSGDTIGKLIKGLREDVRQIRLDVDNP